MKAHYSIYIMGEPDIMTTVRVFDVRGLQTVIDTGREDTMPDKNLLLRLGVFENVPEVTLEKLWNRGKVERCAKGRIIIRAKEALETIYIQLSGKSIVYNLTHTGKRKILFVFGAGMLLNEHVLNEHDSAMYCETIEQSEIFAVSAAEFMALMEEDFSLVKTVMVVQERKIWRLGHQLKNTMGSIYMERKLAAKLWKLSRDFGFSTPDGIEIDINMTVTFLADMLGAPRETTSRLCKALADYGLIRMNNRRIVIIDPERISQFYKTGKIE